MSKTINFKYEGTDYTLEFTRKSIEIMERQGFVAGEISTRPMTTLPALFAGAFIAHHRMIKPEKVDEIFNKLSDKDKLIEKLAEMYNEPLETLMSDPEEPEGNVDWGTSW